MHSLLIVLIKDISRGLKSVGLLSFPFSIVKLIKNISFTVISIFHFGVIDSKILRFLVE